MIFSHISGSIYTGSESGGHAIVRLNPARSIAERNVDASSAVYADKSIGWKLASTRPASMREKSSSVLTSLSRRRLLRCAV